MANDYQTYSVRIVIAWWLRWAKYPWVIYRVLLTGRACTPEEVQAFIGKAIRVKVVPAKWGFRA